MLGVVAPGREDWIVTLLMRDGTVYNRRITPGNMTDEQALALALRVQRVRPDQVVDASCRRAGDQASVIIENQEEEFERLLARMRGTHGTRG